MLTQRQLTIQFFSTVRQWQKKYIVIQRQKYIKKITKEQIQYGCAHGQHISPEVTQIFRHLPFRKSGKQIMSKYNKYIY
jgi:hypothetical protein